MLSTKEAHQNTNFHTFILAGVKIHQISHAIFQTKSHFFFIVCITLPCYETQLFCTFLAENLYALDKKSPSKCKFLDCQLLT